jgi:hypothetical protein
MPLPIKSLFSLNFFHFYISSPARVASVSKVLPISREVNAKHVLA